MGFEFSVRLFRSEAQGGGVAVAGEKDLRGERLGEAGRAGDRAGEAGNEVSDDRGR